MARRIKKKVAAPEDTSFGEELIAALTELRDALASGDPASYPGVTVREVHYEPPPKIGSAAIRGIRQRSGLGRHTFASAVGVTPATVERWERGERFPAGSAARALQMMDADPERYLKTVGIHSNLVLPKRRVAKAS